MQTSVKVGSDSSYKEPSPGVLVLIRLRRFCKKPCAIHGGYEARQGRPPTMIGGQQHTRNGEAPTEPGPKPQLVASAQTKIHV